jgi:hypothetical protein
MLLQAESGVICRLRRVVGQFQIMRQSGMWLSRIGVLLVLWQLEIDVYGRFHLDDLPVRHQRPKFPLGVRLRRRLDEQWVPLFDLDYLY